MINVDLNSAKEIELSLLALRQAINLQGLVQKMIAELLSLFKYSTWALCRRWLLELTSHPRQDANDSHARGQSEPLRLK